MTLDLGPGALLDLNFSSATHQPAELTKDLVSKPHLLSRPGGSTDLPHGHLGRADPEPDASQGDSV